MIIQGQKRQECILYAVLWAILFVAPVVGMYLGESSLTLSGDTGSSLKGLDWQAVCESWQLLATFFIAFLIHNFLLSPLLVYGNKKWQYFSLLFALIACFTLYQCLGHAHHEPPRKELTGRPPHAASPRGEHDMPEPPEGGMLKDAPYKDNPQKNKPHEGENKPHEGARPDGPHQGNPPMPLGGREMVAFVIMVMIVGLNDGAKYYFKSQSDRKRLIALEHENLTQKLEYLRYQVNPHFLMNTLNNIHALVDFDPEQAKDTIEKLSKLMRYILYDSNKEFVPLEKELDFIRLYVSIMRIRYTDHVKIDLQLPEQMADIQIPPLIYIIFIENAFKHGISYEHPSYIIIGVTIGERSVDFTCRNSRKGKTEKDQHGGIGLQNVEKRLQLIYGDSYQLCIQSTDDEYLVSLSIPIR